MTLNRLVLLSSLFLPLVHCSSPEIAEVAGEAGDGKSDGVDGDDSSEVPEPSGVSCTGKSDAVDSGKRTLVSGDRDRSYHVYVPSSYAPDAGHPVVLNLHAYTQNPQSQATLSRMNAKAESEGFLVVYPVGTGLDHAFNAGECCGWASTIDVDDVGYIEDVLDAVDAEFCVDPDRVLSTGLSNGGFMSHRLGCELSERIAGIAPVAGAMGVDECEPSLPVAVMGFHGTSDSLVNFHGSWLRGLPSFFEAMDEWAERNGCSADVELVSAVGDTTCARYSDCPNGGGVAYCVVEDGGHTWPGGDDSGLPAVVVGKTTQDVSATDEMWSFFASQTAP